MSTATGTVQVAIDIARKPAETWAALSRPRRLREWFGTPDGPLTPGAPVTIDFGDGDFFVVSVRRVEPPARLEFSWRFLGVGPEDQITWTVEPAAAGSRVTVVDREPDRDETTVAALTDGWRDFLGRLRHHAETGEPARYGWRADIDGSVDVPAGRSPAALPVFADGAGSPRFVIADGAEPRSFAIEDWAPAGDDRLSFAVRIPPARTPTRATVRIDRTGTGRRRLYVEHTGWAELELDDETARALRARFAAAWIDALRTAAS